MVALLIEAYDRALAALRDGGQPDIVQEIIARRIIEAAPRGERNLDRLCDAGLFGMQRSDQRPNSSRASRMNGHPARRRARRRRIGMFEAATMIGEGQRRRPCCPSPICLAICERAAA